MYCVHIVLWRVRVAPPINVGSGSDDRILLAAQLQPVLITDVHSAIAIPHIKQSRHTTIHTESMSQQSSSLTAYSWNTHCNCRHSQLALTITLWLTALHRSDFHIDTDLLQARSDCTRTDTTIHSRNHTKLLWSITSTARVSYRRLLKHFSAVLPELHWLPYWHSYAHWLLSEYLSLSTSRAITD
jgi:hypothetical protein